MKVITIHGVPYHINDKQEVFLYEKASASSSSSTPSTPAIGTWDASCQRLHLHTNWQTLIQPNINIYRTNLKTHTEEETQKAKELQKV